MSSKLNLLHFGFIKSKVFLAIIALFVLFSAAVSFNKMVTKEPVIYIQPLGSVDSESLNYLKKSVEGFFGFKCIIKTRLELTNDILSRSKTRYDANKILSKYNSIDNCY